MSVLFKIIFIAIVSTHVAECSSIICYLGSVNDSKELPLKQAPEFLDTPYLSPDKELVMITHGYSAAITEYHTDVITNYMNVYGDNKSYCAFNWTTEANAYIGPLTKPIKTATGTKVILIDYPAVAIIASEVGKELGDVIAQLNITYYTLIGHSQGAHLFGDTGREVFEKTGKMIDVIVGLDPAKPPIERPLDKTCADFVWCLHTNPDLFGTNWALGDVDFWANYGCTVQPGCPSFTNVTNRDLLCSHIRSLQIMADAVKDSNSLPGREAASYSAWVSSSGDPDPADVNYIGLNVDSSKPGSFYLSTNAQSPYGKGTAGMDPANRTCK